MVREVEWRGAASARRAAREVADATRGGGAPAWPCCGLARDRCVGLRRSWSCPGPRSPTGDTYLSWFGCAGLFDPPPAGPSATVGADAAAPLGSRATRLLRCPATGQASGPVHRVDSVGGATWSMWVRPVTRAAGASPTSGTSPPSSTRARSGPAAPTWRPPRGVAAGPPRPARFTLEPASPPRPARSCDAGRHRDARRLHPGARRRARLPAGRLRVRRGAVRCSDAVATGATTYDLEGFPVSTTIAASASPGRARDRGDAHRA